MLAVGRVVDVQQLVGAALEQGVVDIAQVGVLLWDAQGVYFLTAKGKAFYAQLMEQGYIKTPKGKQKPAPPNAPLEFMSSDGFKILVGRNNRQNDRLTMKEANNNDIWLHTKNIPGSHTILVTEGREATDAAIVEAAKLAAYHSKGKDSSQVPVDYTQVRYVSKPQGAKPGMVIYVNYKTVYVTPQKPLENL